MSIETLLIGYRPGDRRIHEIVDKYGIRFLAVRKCIGGCGYPVHFNASGLATARDRDADVICENCMNENRAEIERSM